MAKKQGLVLSYDSDCDAGHFLDFSHTNVGRPEL